VQQFKKSGHLPEDGQVAFALSYAANLFILMISYEFCLLPAQFYYMIMYIRKVESRMQIAGWCATWKISSGAEDLVLQAP
jgi:hypothetical protein